MSTLSMIDRRSLESLLGMSSGVVLDFSNRTFREFVFEAVKIDIEDERYAVDGPSKAKRLRAFWKLESDYTVGQLLLALIRYSVANNPGQTTKEKHLEDTCNLIAERLIKAGPSLDRLKQQARIRDAAHLAELIRRLEESVETDPSLAIGTAKDLIETCCKTILDERGKPTSGNPDIPKLTKDTLKELRLAPDDIHESAKGSDVMRDVLRNLGQIGKGLAELRNLYGTGHGKAGRTRGLAPRHARLAAGAAATLTTFLFETHSQSRS